MPACRLFYIPIPSVGRCPSGQLYLPEGGSPALRRFVELLRQTMAEDPVRSE
jgi:hypothetical protein